MFSAMHTSFKKYTRIFQIFLFFLVGLFILLMSNVGGNPFDGSMFGGKTLATVNGRKLKQTDISRYSVAASIHGRLNHNNSGHDVAAIAEYVAWHELIQEEITKGTIAKEVSTDELRQYAEKINFTSEVAKSWRQGYGISGETLNELLSDEIRFQRILEAVAQKAVVDESVLKQSALQQARSYTVRGLDLRTDTGLQTRLAEYYNQNRQAYQDPEAITAFAITAKERSVLEQALPQATLAAAATSLQDLEANLAKIAVNGIEMSTTNPVNPAQGLIHGSEAATQAIAALTTAKPVSAIIGDAQRGFEFFIFRNKGGQLPLNSIEGRVAAELYADKLEAFLKANEASFTHPASFSPALIRFSAAPLLANIKITDEQIADTYAKTPFFQTAQVKVRIASISLGADGAIRETSQKALAEFKAQVASGALSFDNIGLLVTGANLSEASEWISPGTPSDAIPGEVLAACVGLKKGQLTEVISTQDALYLAQISDERANTPLAEASPQIREYLARQAAGSQLMDKAQVLLPKLSDSAQIAATLKEISTDTSLSIQILPSLPVDEQEKSRSFIQLYSAGVPFPMLQDIMSLDPVHVLSTRPMPDQNGDIVIACVHSSAPARVADLKNLSDRQSIAYAFGAKEIAAAQAVKANAIKDELAAAQAADIEALLSKYGFQPATVIGLDSTHPLKDQIRQADLNKLPAAIMDTNREKASVILIQAIAEPKPEDLEKATASTRASLLAEAQTQARNTVLDRIRLAVVLPEAPKQ